MDRAVQVAAVAPVPAEGKQRIADKKGAIPVDVRGFWVALLVSSSLLLLHLGKTWVGCACAYACVCVFAYEKGSMPAIQKPMWER